MKKKTAAGFALMLALTACVSLPACNTENAETYSHTYYAMGTSADLVSSSKGISAETFEALAERVGDFLTQAENSLSLAVKTSCMYKFNKAQAGETVEIDGFAYEVLSKAIAVYNQTDGSYNPGVWHSANAYRFAVSSAGDENEFPYRQGAFRLPDEKYVTAFQTLSQSFSQLELSQKDGKYYATKPQTTVSVEGDDTVYNLRIDLGGIGKGWCADRISGMLDEAGVEYGYIDFGTSSMCIKKYAGNESGDYTVIARDPRGEYGTAYFGIAVQNLSLSTSGDNQQYYEVDGVRYCHIIDPVTGSPIQTGVASVTVLGANSALCDAYTTALASMGKNKAVEFINGNLTDYKVVMLVFEDGVGKIITNCPQSVQVRNDNYKICNSVENGKIILN